MYKSIGGENPLKDGTIVKAMLFRDDNSMYQRTGVICGIASELPVLGFMYIIKFSDEIISERYPYTACVLSRCFIMEQNQ
jgi:hypothetical protein